VEAAGLPDDGAGKTYEYLDAGRPILALLEEATRRPRWCAARRHLPARRREVSAEIERRYLAWKEGAPAQPRAPGVALGVHSREPVRAPGALLDGLAAGRDA